MHQRIKLDPVAYILLSGILALQIYAMFLRRSDPSDVMAESDRAYQAAVFNSDENKGVMHQVFRQNEVDRELLKAVLIQCSR